MNLRITGTVQAYIRGMEEAVRRATALNRKGHAGSRRARIIIRLR